LASRWIGKTPTNSDGEQREEAGKNDGAGIEDAAQKPFPYARVEKNQ
jgi:hypothetical protein